MGKLLTIWRGLKASSSFVRDWYGELTNQISHKHLGLLAALAIVSAWVLAYGTAPYRGWVFLGVVGPYAAYEAWVQRWLHGDSWFDIAMVASGAAMALIPWTVHKVDGPILTVDLDLRLMGAINAVWLAFLGARVLKRVAK